MMCNISTLPIEAPAEQSTTDAPLTLADLEKLPTSSLYDLYGSSSTVEIWEMLTRQRTKPSRRLQVFAHGSVSQLLLWCSLAAASIVIGLYAILYVATSGSHWLLP
jgi:hypothetical protein